MNKIVSLNVMYLILPLFVSFFYPEDIFAAAENNWVHSFYFENDLFSGTDSNYTNGVKYAIISPDLSPSVKDSGQVPKKVLTFIHKLPFIAKAPPETAHKVEFSFGQNMYTPADISSSSLLVNERPYAGWSYFGTAYHRKSIKPKGYSQMDTAEVQVGLVGPESYTEETQKFVHELRRLQTPNGWDNQLVNEPGLVLAFERKWLFHPQLNRSFGWDAITHVGGAVGNVSTHLNAGVEARVGWNIPANFGVSLIRPAGSTRIGYSDQLSIYILGAVDSRLVLRDIFLDGNSFTDSHNVSKKPVVADFAGGFAVNYGKFMFTWTQILRTKEFEKQANNHSFGAISLSWFFSF